MSEGNAELIFGPPVFVLCAARSGSTLLRFVLDAHPDLACPPETNLPALCAQLATVWSLIEGAPLSPERGEEPPAIPDAAIAGIRHTVDMMTGSYLARRGGKRYCDKSLCTAGFAELLLRVYPDAKFLCLYRHPMDMIASGIEACPWGLRGYGFDPYIAASPGNIVLALARYWNDNAAAILAAEEQFSESSHRIRYEDLVTEPEGTAAGIFEFLGVPQAPGITSRCFTAERERSGPADYKIWHTSEIAPGSVGRSWTLPAGQIPDPVLEQMNEMAGRLGYRPVDGGWGMADAPGDLRTDGGGRVLRGQRSAGDGAEAEARMGKLLDAGLAGTDGEFTRRWGPRTGAPFGIVITGPASPARWRIDLAAGNVTRLADGEQDGTEWDVIGSAQTWEAVLDGRVNLGVALRRHDLRYCDTGDDGHPFAADSRIDMLGDFLGLASWPVMASGQGGFDGSAK
jgi:hypothetical protein